MRENGWVSTAAAAAAGLFRRMDNGALSAALPGRPNIRIGSGSQVRGLRHIRIGRDFVAGRGLWLEAVTAYDGTALNPEIQIGDNVQVNDHVHIAAAQRVTIGNDVLMASRVYVSDHNHGGYEGDEHSSPDIAPRLRPLTYRPTRIGDRVWLGEMVSVLPGVTIGAGSIIGAGSVVTHDIPPNTIAVGTPARVVKRYDYERQLWIRT